MTLFHVSYRRTSLFSLIHDSGQSGCNVQEAASSRSDAEDEPEASRTRSQAVINEDRSSEQIRITSLGVLLLHLLLLSLSISFISEKSVTSSLCSLSISSLSHHPEKPFSLYSNHFIAHLINFFSLHRSLRFSLKRLELLVSPTHHLFLSHPLTFVDCYCSSGLI